jgi:hypothetical protein
MHRRKVFEDDKIKGRGIIHQVEFIDKTGTLFSCGGTNNPDTGTLDYSRILHQTKNSGARRRLRTSSDAWSTYSRVIGKPQC